MRRADLKLNDHRLSEILTFLKLVEFGSFTAAARELGVAQSTVSRRLSELEQRVRCKLVERTTRRIVFTEPGLRYAETLQSLMNGLNTAESELNSSTRKPGGTLRLSVPTGYGRSILVPLLSKFADRNPDVRLDIDFSDRYVDLISDGYDFAVRMSEPVAKGLRVRRGIRSIQLRLCASPSFLRRFPVHSAQDLVNERCIVQRTYAPRNSISFRMTGKLHRLEVRPRLIANDILALTQLTLHGQGIGLLPDFLTEDALKSGQLQLALPDARFHQIPVYFVTPSHKSTSINIASLFEFLAEEGLI